MKKTPMVLHSKIVYSALFLTCVLMLLSCTRNPMMTENKTIEEHTYHCHDAQSLAGKKIGDGHCVSLIKFCSGAPNTAEWRPGKFVMQQSPGSLKTGTIIATFHRDRYPNKTGWHAAVYISHGPDGIWVWDQWLSKPVHKRLIRVRRDSATPANSAHHYRIVKFN